MAKITYRQLSYIVDLKLRPEEEAKNMTKEEANLLLKIEVPKFHVRKLLEWGVKTEEELAVMFPKELRNLYNSSRTSRKINFLKEGLKDYEVNEEVWCKQVVNGEEVKIPCTISAIRNPEFEGRYFKNLSNNITVEFSDGKHKAVDLGTIEKKK